MHVENMSSRILWTVSWASLAMKRFPKYWLPEMPSTIAPIISRYLTTCGMSPITIVSMMGLSMAFAAICEAAETIIKNMPPKNSSLLNLK